MEGDTNPNNQLKEAGYSFLNKTKFNPSESVLKPFIEQLNSPDDMELLTSLMTLSDTLSYASDRISDDPNCIPIMEALFNALDRMMIPDTTSISVISFFSSVP